MKYLENDQLQQLTAALTDAAVSGRVVNGRLEAYSMKRAGMDKKYSKTLGERYVAEMESMENQMMTAYQIAAASTLPEEQENNKAGQATRKRSQSAGIFEDVYKYKHTKLNRERASSFDLPVLPGSGRSHRSESTEGKPSTAQVQAGHQIKHFSQRTALGDFTDQSTRKLMTNLILTLNASFPDYDFSSVKPTDFAKIDVSQVMQHCNERLSEVAATKSASFLTDLWTAVDGQIQLQDCDVYSYQPVVGDEQDDPLHFLTETLVQSSDENMTVETDTSQTLLWSLNYFFVNRHLKRIIFFTCIETMQLQHDLVQEDDGEEASSRYVKWSSGADEDVDFDLDPSDRVGGVPISTV
jgi:hypothetical protein